MINIPEKENIELRIKCLELAIATRDVHNETALAERYYNFIVGKLDK